MSDDYSLAPDVRDQLLDTLDEMEEVLRSIAELAERQGSIDDWWAVAQQMIAIRARLRLGPLGSDFSEALEDLNVVYRSFVATLLPGD